MNLYKILFSHHAPKDSEQGIKALVIATNDEQVYDWLASEPTVKDNHIFNSWKEREGYTYDEKEEVFLDEYGEEVDGFYDDEGNEENFKDRMLRLRGEIDDDSVDFSDAYYGITLYGWELIKENTVADYSELIEAGIVVDISK